MLIQLDFYPPLAKAGDGDYEMPSLRAWVQGCVCVCVCMHVCVSYIV